MDELPHILERIRRIPRALPVGRVGRIEAGVLRVTGLAEVASLGDQVRLECRSKTPLTGEIIAIAEDDLAVLPNGPCDGVSLDDRVIHLGRADIYPSDAWLGRIIDPFGAPLDGQPLKNGWIPTRILATPPPPAERRGFGSRFDTGLATFDTFLPLVRGQRLGIFAGSGVGKSTLLGDLAQGVTADVVVLALIGERGREVMEFVAKVLGPEGMARTVVVAATSDQAPQVRRRAAWTAMAVAEYFRDGGSSVLLLADSITRFAEAHREVAAASGEMPSLGGFPPSTAQTIMQLCERAGPGHAYEADISAIFTILVPGSDMEGPIADIMRGVLDGHVVLEREIAERGRYPAINLLRSVSRSLPEAANAEQNETLAEARRLLGTYEEARLMIQAGLYKRGQDMDLDRAVALWPKLDRFLARPSKGIEWAFDELSQVLNLQPAKRP
ncbi:MAG: FliI/YscN family ATPase [Pseudomonadota bacterium]